MHPTLALVLPFVPLITAHTRFTTLYVDSVSQGDFTCVRMDPDMSQTTNPISSPTSPDMACGVAGEVAVPSTCAVAAGSTLSFLHRDWPDGSQPGVIDDSHKGPCAVYMKPLSTPDASAQGPGWFKIYEAGYDEASAQWCTEKLIANGGLLSAVVPSDLSGGNYLVRVELLALQNAQNADPQFYVGCAQAQLSGGAESTNSSSSGALRSGQPQTVSIPDGYVDLSTPGLTFNIYDEPLKLPYPMFGPAVYGTGSAGNANVALGTSSSSVSTVVSSGNGASPGPSSNDQGSGREAVAGTTTRPVENSQPQGHHREVNGQSSYRSHSRPASVSSNFNTTTSSDMVSSENNSTAPSVDDNSKPWGDDDNEEIGDDDDDESQTSDISTAHGWSSWAQSRRGRRFGGH